MGIRNLNKFLQKHAPQIFSEKHLSEYSGKRIAIDITLYLYRFKTSHRGKWMNAFLNMIALLRKFSIQCIFIYDTKAPDMKYAKIQERKLRRATAEKRIQDIQTAIDEWNAHGESEHTEILTLIMEKHSNHSLMLLQPINVIAIPIKLDVILMELSRLEKQIVYISRQDIQSTKDILDILGIVHFDSPNEAETMASHMCCHGLVHAVLSNDTDVTTYGTPVFLSNLNREMVTELKIVDILESTELTLSQFRDLCIMCGTDYNNNIYRIGSEKSYRLIKKYGSIEEIRDQGGVDVAILEHEQVRELFRVPETLPELDLQERPTDMIKLQEFLTVHHCNSDLITSLMKNEIK